MGMLSIGLPPAFLPKFMGLHLKEKTERSPQGNLES